LALADGHVAREAQVTAVERAGGAGRLEIADLEVPLRLVVVRGPGEGRPRRDVFALARRLDERRVRLEEILLDVGRHPALHDRLDLLRLLRFRQGLEEILGRAYRGVRQARETRVLLEVP